MRTGLFCLLFFLIRFTGICQNNGQTDNNPGKVTIEGRWSKEKATGWYNNQQWIIGANYVPANAINMLEMWQKETFSPELIDKELDYAGALGFTTMRVFLAYLPWKDNKKAYFKRIDQFLEICARHGIKPMFVFFDDVWNPYPKAGRQPEAKKGVHNSGWVQCPGIEILGNLNRHDELKPYVQDILKRYANDNRVLAWDLYNEPANTNSGSYGKVELQNKVDYSMALLKKVFSWAREIKPSQPLTVGVWTLGTSGLDKLSPIDNFAFENSDIISFHSYMDASSTEILIRNLASAERPVICTEYMARETGSTFQAILPVFKKYKVGAINWGFVSGKSQTIYPWHSWDTPFDTEPELWFHDIFRQNGTPYKKEETDFIKSFISR